LRAAALSGLAAIMFAGTLRRITDSSRALAFQHGVDLHDRYFLTLWNGRLLCSRPLWLLAIPTDYPVG